MVPNGGVLFCCFFKWSNTEWQNCRRDYEYSFKFYIFQPSDSVVLWIFIQTATARCLPPTISAWFENKQILNLHICVLISVAVCLQNHLGHISFSIYITFGYATGLKCKIYYLRTSYKSLLWTLSLNLSLPTFDNLLCVQPRLSQKSKHITSVSTRDLYHINNAASSDSPWKAPVLEGERVSF